MADQQLYKVHEVTARLGVTDQTVRMYCNRYGQFLSGHASPGPGQTRRFTESDLRVLTLIRDKSAERGADVAAALRSALNTGALPDVPELPTTRGVGAIAVQAARESWLAERAGLQREIELLQGQLERLQSQYDTERAARIDDLHALAELQAQLGRAQAVLELYESGRLRPSEG